MAESTVKKTLRILTMNSKMFIGVIILVSLIVIAGLESPINSYRLGGRSPIQVGIYPRSLRESFEHPLGTDLLGRDIFALLLTGLKFTLLVGFFSGSIAALVAVVMALFAGYKGGIYDSILGSITNTILVIPLWPILVSILAFTRVNLITMCLTIAAFSWPWPARTIRAQVLSLKEREYIWLAKMSALRDTEIIFKEILPNILPYIGVSIANAVLGAIGAETGVRVVGFGPTDVPSLGLLIFWAQQWGYFGSGRYLQIIFPALLIILIFMSLNLINIGLEEIYNPRLKKITGA